MTLVHVHNGMYKGIVRSLYWSYVDFNCISWLVVVMLNYVSVEQIHSVSTVQYTKTSYCTVYTTEYCCLTTTFRCPSDILITSCWLCTARWNTWLGNHLVPCVAELVGFCILIYAYWSLPDPKCLFYPSSLSTNFALSQSMTLFTSTAWSVMADLWVSLLSLAVEARVCVPAVKEFTSFLCSLILRPNFLPVSAVRWTLKLSQ